MKTRLGNLERQLLAYAQMRDAETLGTGDLLEPLGISPRQEAELFARLCRAGAIARVRRGLYLIPRRLPLGGSWSPDLAQALNALMGSCKASWQICGPAAFNRYGFDGQIPVQTSVYNNRIYGDREIGAVSFTFIKVEEGRLGGVEENRTPEGKILRYSSRTRTLVDAVYDWSRFNSLPRGYAWIRAELSCGRVTIPQLIDLTLAYGNVGTTRRMGVLLEKVATDASDIRGLNRLAKNLEATGSTIPWIPVLPKRGRVDKRWGVVINGEC